MAAIESKGKIGGVSQILTIRVTNPGNILRLCQYSWHNPTPGWSREVPKKRRRTWCTIGAVRNGHIRKCCATSVARGGAVLWSGSPIVARRSRLRSSILPEGGQGVDARSAPGWHPCSGERGNGQQSGG